MNRVPAAPLSNEVPTMRRNPFRFPMDLDIDSFLQSHGGDLSSSSSDDDGSATAHRRAVDEILNDTDSDSDSSPKTTPSKDDTVTPKEEPRSNMDRQLSAAESLEEPSSTFYLGRRIGELYSSSGLASSSSRPFPALFGGVMPKPKPGAALAAAAAASRPIPTPHAAAIKSRRASSGLSLEMAGDHYVEGSFVADVVDDSLVASSSSRLGGNDADGRDDLVDSSLTSYSPSSSSSSSSSGVDLAVHEVIHGEQVSSGRELCSSVVERETSENVEFRFSNTVNELQSSGQLESTEYLEDLPSATKDSVDIDVNVPNINENFLVSVKENDANAENAPGTSEADLVTPTNIPDSFDAKDVNDRDSSVGEVSGGLSELDNLSEVRVTESGSQKKADMKSLVHMKPLDWAEELEKQQASSGLHWEEGAVAQPMRLEGIRRGPPAVGYLQMDLDNTITRVVSSQSFKHDCGSLRTLAVHMNYIAVGTSKGTVLVFSSTYSPHHADKMDGKVLTFGSSGEKIQVPVSSMCFNQQGDLLLVGYNDGHLAIWDVQRGASAKVITGEHNAPVTHTLFLGQDSQFSRQFKAVTGDAKGLVLLHTSSVLPLLNHFSIKTQCLLDGQKTGIVLCASSIVMDNCHDAGNTSAQFFPSVPTSGLGSKVGGVVGGDTGWKLFNGNPSVVEEGVVVFATNQNALVVRLSPTVEVYEKLSRPDGVREGSLPYAAWKNMVYSHDSFLDASDKVAWLAIAWDRNIQVSRLVKSEMKKCEEWILDSSAIGVAWLDDQMLVVLTIRGQLCLFSRDGSELYRTNFAVDCFGVDDFIIYHTHYINAYENSEKAYHNSVAVRGATIYILGPMHLIISRLLPWKERIQVLQKAGDWMGALDMALKLYDGHAHGVIDLPRTVEAIRETIMPYLVELILLYVDEVFSYISVAFYNQIDKVVLIEDPNMMGNSVRSEIEEQYALVGGVTVEFCVHIKRTDILFDGIFSKFVAVLHEGTFLEILEPYILRDMLGCLPPEIMQALVEHYSSKGWLERVEQCVLHMDISSLDFNQVARLCREHGLYGALIYLFNRGLDDFKAPLEELLLVVQKSSRMDVAAIGYRMLVYLKYCFQGLAFPPGHGHLPPSRLASVREELLNFLLEDSKFSTSQLSERLKSLGGNVPNLYYALSLDIEATLEVLKCAFNNVEASNDRSVHDLATSCIAQENHHQIVHSKTQHKLAQCTANTLITILDLESDVVQSFEMDDNAGTWPSEKDTNSVLEFIVYLVASKQATVSARVLEHILEYLTSSKLTPSDPSRKDKASVKEKQLLLILQSVPQEIWSSSFVLPLCLEAQFFQACGLIHYIRGEYVAALNSYMKDLNEPIHAFSFISKMFLQLENTEALSFKSAVILQIPELVKLSRECTFLLVIDQLGSESQNILSHLHSHPQSLFLFLKTLIEVHRSGTLNFPVPETAHTLNIFYGGMRDLPDGLADYLNKLTNFPKLMHHDAIEVTDEIAELYLELLCQYDRHSVLKFLETFDNYRLEHCLKLCQEYGVTDAAAFLLERVGDIGSALVLLMSGLDEKIELLVSAVENKFSDLTSRIASETKQLADIFKLTEALAVRDVVHTSVGLCQRNTQRLDRQEAESLWFRLFDSFSEPLRRFCSAKEISEGHNYNGRMTTAWKYSKLKGCANLLRRLFSQFIGEIIEGMAGYLTLPAVMAKLLSDNGSHEFGDFKITILNMLGTYKYERRILDTAKSLIGDDIFCTLNVLRKDASRAFAPQNLICCICSSPLLIKGSSSLGIRVFKCGHAAHLYCESEENESSKTHFVPGCPVCQHKNAGSRGKTSISENGLIDTSMPASRQIREISGVLHLYETDVVDKPFGVHHLSRFDFLDNLRKGKSLAVDPLPQLRLAPPAIYHEKVHKGPVFLSREMHDTIQKRGKPNKRWQLMESKLKGSSDSVTLKVKKHFWNRESAVH